MQKATNSGEKKAVPAKFPLKGRAGYLARKKIADEATSAKAPTNSRSKDTGWGKVAAWYHETVEDRASYQKDLIMPNLLRLMDIQPGQKILDLGCGEGLFTRRFAKAGAEVTAIDIALPLIEIAKREAASENEHYKFQPRFFVSDAASIPLVPSTTQDAVVINLALQNIENVAGVFKECARVLKPGGKLFIVLNHPAFRIPKATEWGWAETGNNKLQTINNKQGRESIQYRRVDQYMTELRTTIDMRPGESAKGKQTESTISFHRPLQYFVKLLGKAGLAIVNMEEWVSNKKSLPGPRAVAEDKARGEFPLFMMLEVKKI
jgi:ubiquinone/menaquinone biosynthesis C-methylase UbiE